MRDRFPGCLFVIRDSITPHHVFQPLYIRISIFLFIRTMGLYGSKPESLDESPPLEEIVDHRLIDQGETSVADDTVIDSSPLNESLSQETGDNIFSDLPPATQIALWKKALHDISIHEIITPPSTILSFEFDYTTKVRLSAPQPPWAQSPHFRHTLATLCYQSQATSLSLFYIG